MLRGKIARHLNIDAVLGKINNTSRRDELIKATRGLLAPIMDKTEFLTAALDTCFLCDGPVFTVLARRDRGNVPYLLRDLANDLVSGSVNRQSIDEPTEHTIRSMAADIRNIPRTPSPVLIEDSSGAYYLVLEGNKRFTAMGLAKAEDVPPYFDVYVGCTSLGWRELLAEYQMRPCA